MRRAASNFAGELKARPVARGSVAWIVMALIGFCGGCINPSANPPFFIVTTRPATPPAGQATPHLLQARLMGFADRYLNRMSEACDRVHAAVSDPQARVMAWSTKVYPSMTVVTLACAEDPQAALRDLLVVVTLERMVWEGAWSKEMFGEHASILTEAQRDMERDIWGIAGSMMSAKQIQEMHKLITDWRRDHPDRQYVSSMRFDNIVMMREAEPEVLIVHQDFLAPLSEAARVVEQTRLLGERTVFLGSHMPVLIQWQLTLFTEELSARPDIRQVLTNSDDFTKATQQFATAVERWPINLSDQSTALSQLVGEIRKTLIESEALTKQIQQISGDGRAMTEALHQTAESTDRIVARFASNGSGPTTAPSRPFDIREYAQTISQLTPALKELNLVLGSTNELAGNSAWQQRLRDVEGITERRINSVSDKSTTLVELLFRRGVQFTAVICAAVLFTALVHRYVCQRMAASKSNRGIKETPYD